MNDLERRDAGKLYLFQNEIVEIHKKAVRLCRQYNNTDDYDFERLHSILQELLGSCPKQIKIKSGFNCDYGSNTFIGENFFANYNFTLVDTGKITIGNNVMFGPNVSLLSANHPIGVKARSSWLFYGKPIVICDNVWLCGGVIVNPGVTIGEGSIIGSGSVVTKDIPPRVIAVGNPCKVLREITDEDEKHWDELVLDYYNN